MNKKPSKNRQFPICREPFSPVHLATDRERKLAADLPDSRVIGDECCNLEASSAEVRQHAIKIWPAQPGRSNLLEIAESGLKACEAWQAAWIPHRDRLNAYFHSLSDPLQSISVARSRIQLDSSANRLKTLLIVLASAACLLLVVCEIGHAASIAYASGAAWVLTNPLMPFVVAAMPVLGLCAALWIWSDNQNRLDSPWLSKSYNLALLLSNGCVLSFSTYYGQLAGRSSAWDEASTLIPAWVHLALTMIALAGSVLCLKAKIIELYSSLYMTRLTDEEREAELKKCQRHLAQIENACRETEATKSKCQAALRALTADREEFAELLVSQHARLVRAQQERDRQAKQHRDGVEDYRQKFKEHDDLSKILKFHPYGPDAQGASA